MLEWEVDGNRVILRRVDELEAQVKDADDASNRLESLEEEHERFRRERGEIRDRIETILSSLEALEV